MSHKKTVMQFRRKRDGRTNYKKRLELLKSRKTRLVVRVSNTQVVAQLIDYSRSGDLVKMSVFSSELKKKGWSHSLNNLPAAYLTGMMLGAKAKGKINEAVLDIGLHSHVPGSRVYAVVKGVVDAGIVIPVSPEVFPSAERLAGNHIAKMSHEANGKSAKSVQDDFKKLKEAVLKA